MKKIFRIFLFVIAFNFVAGLGFMGWLSYSLVVPSLNAADISFFELFSKEIELDKLATFEDAISCKAELLGKDAADKFMSGFKKILPNPDFDYSEVPAPEYPYPSADEVLNDINNSSHDALKAGLNVLEEVEDSKQ